MKWPLVIGLVLVLAACQKQEKAKMSPQHPSPMVDYTRPHERIPLDSIVDSVFTLRLSPNLQGTLYLPPKWKNRDSLSLLMHFHGGSRVAQHAVAQQTEPWLLLHFHWGNGSGAYQRPVVGFGAEKLLDSLMSRVHQTFPELTNISGVYLSAWSAGYGAVRSLISEEEAGKRIKGILLMDGLHCSYVPESQVLSEGGALDSTQMQAFAHWARMAAAGEKSFLITHSAVFPGTYASTTETADFLLQMLHVSRQPQLREGPVGMQQTSVAAKGNFQVWSFAGNTAPDHVDHYHGMGAFVGALP